MKKIFALVLALMLVLGMTSAMAASIEIKDSATSDHQYKVYQIFTGTLLEETNASTGEKTKTLSDIKYGENYKKGGADADAVAEAKAFANSAETARQFATRLTDKNNTNGEISGDPVATLTKPNFKVEGLDDGYYLIVDDTTVALTADGDMYSRYIVQVSGETQIAPKKSTVEEDKNITADEHNADTTNDTNGTTTGEDISADHKADDVSIGEKVTYTINATIPLSAADYDTFFFIINDTLSEGLTFLPDTLEVYHDEIKNDNKLTVDTQYKLLKATDANTAVTAPHTFEVPILNAKDRAGQTIYVVYQAELNEHARIGELDNTNKTTVTYSNNPENKYDGKDKDNDGKPDDMTEKIYGKTPEVKTRTFTSSIRIRKVDENGTALQGAAFTISGISVKTVLVTTDKYEISTDTDAIYYLLNDGTYTTVAPSNTDTYKSVGTNAREGGYVSDGNGGYRIATYDELKDTTVEKFVKVTATTDQYNQSHINDKYKKTTVTEKQVTSSNVTEERYVDENGYVRFDGLGSGTYTITETKIPAGYNGIDSFTVTIGFDKEDADQDETNNNTRDDDGLVWFANSNFVKDEHNTEGTITEIDSNNDGTADTFQIQVKNNKGNTLPETGGIGTTLFYIGGSILVLAAVILLVTKRRMSAND